MSNPAAAARRDVVRRAPVVHAPPPAYLSAVPGRYLMDRRKFDPERLVAYLRDFGIAARPTLAEIESERARRHAAERSWLA